MKLSKRYINDRFLPDKAIDLIDEASSKKDQYECQPGKPIKKLREELKKLSLQKEEAVINGEYEQAGIIKRKESSKKTKLEKAEAEWEADMKEQSLVVGDDDIEGVVSE